MNDLADRIVALGIGYREEHYPAKTPFYYHKDCSMPMEARDFVSAAPVVMALMEKCNGVSTTKSSGTWHAWISGHSNEFIATNDEQAIAIATACCEALENDSAKDRQ